MDSYEKDVLYTLLRKPFVNQSILAESCGHSLGIVNRSLKNLVLSKYLDSDFRLTEKAHQEFDRLVPRRAIILAAGFGMRIVPINLELNIPVRRSRQSGKMGAIIPDLWSHLFIAHLFGQIQYVGTARDYISLFARAACLQSV